MEQERRDSRLIEVGSGIWRFTDGEEIEWRVRRELAKLHRRNLEHWKRIQFGSPAEWQEMEKLIQRLESERGVKTSGLGRAVRAVGFEPLAQILPPLQTPDSANPLRPRNRFCSEAHHHLFA